MKESIRVHRTDGTTMAQLLYPVQGYRDELKRKGLQPKDHQMMYRQELKQIQTSLKEVKDTPIRSSTPKLPTQLASVRSKVETNIFNPGTISRPVSAKNYVIDNIRTAITKKPVCTERTLEEDFKQKHKTYGKIPKYLEKAKQEILTKKLSKESLIQKEKWPKGTRMLDEQDRLERLQNLQQERREVNERLNQLPFTSDTLATQRRRSELETRLKEIESGISRYSVAKVYVPINP